MASYQLALQEYSDYVSKFGDTPQASDAQYYVGSIHYSDQEWGDAVKAFDTLLQKYPDSKRTPETLYYKADSLARLGRWQEANSALKELRLRFPDSPLSQTGAYRYSRPSETAAGRARPEAVA